MDTLMAYSRKDPRKDWASSQDFIKLRRDNWMTAVRELQKEATHSPPEDFPGCRKIATLDDAVETLGIGIGTRRSLARKMIKEIAADTRRAYAIAKEATNSFDKYTVREIVSRGIKLSELKRKSMNDNSDLFKADDGRASALKQGYSPFSSKKGGLRKPGKSGSFDYWYPGQGFSKDPHDEEHGDHHEEHEKATPSKEVAEAWSKVQDLAAQHGVKISNKGVFPNQKTSLDDIEAMKKKLNDTITGNKVDDVVGARKESDDGKDNEENEDTEPANDSEDDPDAGSEDDPDAGSEDDPEDDNSDPADGVEPELDPEKDLGFKLDDDGNPIGHDVPESAHEVEQLRAQVKDLMGIIEKLDEKLDEHHRDQTDRVRRQARQVHANPSPQAVFWLAKSVSTLLTIGGWATVGLLAGGPAGMILGYAFGHHINQQKRIAEASQAQHHQERAGGGGGGTLSRVEKHDHEEHLSKLEAKLKSDNEVDDDSTVKMAPRERLQLLDDIDYAKWRSKNGVALDRKETNSLGKSNVFLDLRTGAIVIRKGDSTNARREARSQLRPIRAKAQANLDKRLDKLLGDLKINLKPAYIPKKKKSAGSDPADYSSWSEDSEQDDNKKLKKKRKAPPIKKSHLRARKPTNEFGHRDDLVPGQKLKLRRTHLMKGTDGFAIVAEDGRFTLGANGYSNGHQLMKALYGKPDHKMTVRRYFKLERG
jgi:hypothetical protein